MSRGLFQGNLLLGFVLLTACRGPAGPGEASLLVPLGLGLALAVALAFAGTVLYRRSDRAAVERTYRQLGALQDPFKVLRFIDLLGMDRPPGQRQPFLERFARRLEQARGNRRSLLPDATRAMGRVAGALDAARRRPGAEERRSVAAAFEAFAESQEALGSKLEEFGDTDNARRARVAAAVHRLFAALVRAESLSHLARLRGEIEEVEDRLLGWPTFAILLGELLGELRRILDSFHQLSQLSEAEDRALVLGQALSHVLRIREWVEAQAQLTSLSASIAVFVLESLRQLLATALQDLHQCAELVLELRSRWITARREAVIVLDVKNVGRGHAHNVEVELLPDEEAFEVLNPRQGVRHLLRRQSARLEFLIKPRASDRIRLRFCLTYGDLERTGQSLAFADVVELRPASVSTFVSLHPNPYVVGRPLGRGDIFVGRKETIERIAASLGGAAQDNVIVLIGQRRVGKTSILRRLRTHLAEKYVPILIDLQGFLAADEAAFYREVTAFAQDELAEAGIEVPLPDGEEFRLDPEGTIRRRFLRPALRAAGKRRLLFMVDEFEVLEERIRSGVLSLQSLSFLRSLVQDEQGLSFLFAGTHRFDELTGDSWRVLFNLAVYLDVGYFSFHQVAELFTEPTKNCFEIDPLALEKAFQLTGGHPHFSQLLARELVEMRNRERLSYVTVQDLSTVADAVVEKGQLHMSYLWNEASRDERLLLLAVRELLDREGLASVAAAHRYLNEHRLEPGDLPAAARRLELQEVLVAQAGHLSFRMELLRRWLRRNQSLELFAMAGTPKEAG